MSCSTLVKENGHKTRHRTDSDLQLSVKVHLDMSALFMSRLVDFVLKFILEVHTLKMAAVQD